MIKAVTAYIENNIADLTINTNLFAGGIEVDKPDKCVIVLESVPGTENYAVPHFSTDSFQFISRDTSYFGARDTAYEIHDLFYGKYACNLSLPAPDSGGDSYILMSCLGTKPFDLGRDEKGRYRFSVNLLMHMELVSS